MSDENNTITLPDALTFHYIKSLQYREIFVEGAFGGVTPRGYISVAFYKERQAIPTSITNKVNENGTLGDEVGRETKEGIVRTVEANLYMDKNTAQILVDWLRQKVDELSQLEDEQHAVTAKESN